MMLDSREGRRKWLAEPLCGVVSDWLPGPGGGGLLVDPPRMKLEKRCPRPAIVFMPRGRSFPPIFSGVARKVVLLLLCALYNLFVGRQNMECSVQAVQINTQPARLDKPVTG